MAFEQTQAQCQRCGKPTLHTRNTEDVPHVLHLLVSVFLCGLWLPVWIAHTVVGACKEGTVPFRCGICGQAAPFAPQPGTLKLVAALAVVVGLIALLTFVAARVLV